MTALLLQNLKLIMLLLMIGTVIGLSHFAGESRNASGLARRMDGSARAGRIPVVGVRLLATRDGGNLIHHTGLAMGQRSLETQFS